MKKTAIACVIVGAVALALSGCSSSSDESTPTSTGPAKVAPPAILQAGTLKICAPNDGTPPNVYHDETGALVGSEVDLGKAIAAQLGLKPDFVESAFAAVIPTLQAKQCDVIMAQLYIKPEREKVVDFVPYVYSGTGIAVSKERPADITGMDDSLCGKKVMVAVGTTAESLSQEQSDKCTAAGKPGIDINRNNHADVSLQQVQNGQVDALPRHRGDTRLLRHQDRCADPDGRPALRHHQDRRGDAEGKHRVAQRDSAGPQRTRE